MNISMNKCRIQTKWQKIVQDYYEGCLTLMEASRQISEGIENNDIDAEDFTKGRMLLKGSYGAEDSRMVMDAHHDLIRWTTWAYPEKGSA